jgi:Asp-tRNA(Asn)/Glu-tRNA(Gln) amidotransferase A subunit family amidase
MLFIPLFLSCLVVVLNGASPTIAFDGHETTIEIVHTALPSGLMTCRDVVSSFLARLEKFNPTINSIISLDPNVLVITDGMDVTPSNGKRDRKPLVYPYY